jgi:hypothetical protein
MSINATLSDFEVLQQMQATVHREESAAGEAKLVNDGTWLSRLDNYEPLAPERLPHAGVRGYRLCFNVDENGAIKRHWMDVFFTPVTDAKGLVKQSKLGAQYATIIGMNEGDTFIDILERGKYTPVMQRITKSEAKNGYKAKNWTQKFQAVKVEA